jgi:hypothetical protein
MVARMAAFLALAGVLSVSSLSAQDYPTQTVDSFAWGVAHTNVYPRVSIGGVFHSPWYNPYLACDIQTNTNTIIQVTSDGFWRQERDCDNNLLNHWDYLPGYASIRKIEDLYPWMGGSPIALSHGIGYDDGFWRGEQYCVSTHNGGFRVHFAVYPLIWWTPPSYDHDAGGYAGDIWIRAMTLPVAYYTDAYWTV